MTTQGKRLPDSGTIPTAAQGHSPAINNALSVPHNGNMGEETLGSWGRPADKLECDKRETGYTRFPLRFARPTRYARGRRSLVDA